MNHAYFVKYPRTYKDLQAPHKNGDRLPFKIVKTIVLSPSVQKSRKDFLAAFLYIGERFMEFMRAYKHLDNLCRDTNGIGLSGYIEDMERNHIAAFRVEGWENDYRQLKHYR